MPRQIARTAAIALAAAVAAACGGSRLPAPAREVQVPTSDGVRLSARVLGSGPDTVIVPLASVWGREMEPLARGRTLLLYDPRARGASERVGGAERLGMERDIEDLEAVRRHFGSPRVALVAWSYFGAVAARYAARHPGDVTRLVLVAPVPPRSGAYPRATPMRAPQPDARLQQLADSLAALGDPVAACRARNRAELAQSTRGPASLDNLRSDPCVHPNEWADSLQATLSVAFAGLRSYDWRQEARGIRAPTLVFTGTEDFAPPAAAQDWAAQMNGRVVEVPGAGHFLHLDDPALVIETADRFLRGAAPGP